MCCCIERFYRIPSVMGEIVEIGFVHDGPALLFKEPREDCAGMELRIDSPYGSIRVDGDTHADVDRALGRLNAMVLRCRKVMVH
jgi:hypothetical protein